jgi:chaperonin GroEL
VEVEERVELAKRTAAAMRGAIKEGVLPGGGVALLACRPILRRMSDESGDPDAQAAYRTLIKAMETPFRTLVSNAGYDASEAMAEVKLAGAGHGFDVTSGQIVDMTDAGIFDTTTVQKMAIFSAIASAGLALTIDVLVHHKEQPDQAAARPPSKKRRI